MHQRRKVLEVHLVAYPVARGHHTEVVEGHLGPFEQGVPFCIPFELQFFIELYGVGPAGMICLNGMIYDQIDGDERIDQFRILSQSLDGRSHGCQVRHRCAAGQILQQYSCGYPRDILSRIGRGAPGCDRHDVIVGYRPVVPLPENGFDYDAYGVRHLADVLYDALLLKLPEREYCQFSLGRLDPLLAVSYPHVRYPKGYLRSLYQSLPNR